MGDVDFDKMRLSGYYVSHIFYFTFTVLLVLIMLQMITGIILDTYSEVKSKAKKKDHLLKTCKSAVRRAWRVHVKRTHLPVHTVFQAVLKSVEERVEEDMTLILVEAERRIEAKKKGDAAEL